MRANLWILLLLTSTLAGCAENAPDVQALDSGVIEIEPGRFVLANTGIVRGSVRNDANLTLADARVSLLGSDHFLVTKGDGAFEFLNVTAGTYELHVLADAFQPSTTPLVVTTGNVTFLDVFLLPEEGSGAGYRPHVHDHWGGAPERVLMDHDVDVSIQKYPTSPYYTNVNTTSDNKVGFYRIPIPESDGGAPSTVLPGTRQVVVTFAWDSTDTTLDRLALQYVPANGDQLVTLARKATGQSWTIGVTPEMTDGGHQAFSLWTFYICTCNDARGAPDWRPAAQLGLVHVKIVLIRGDDVPLEPAHPDFWAGREKLVLRAKEEPYTYIPPLLVHRAGMSGCMSLATPRLVPPGTNRIRIEFDVAYGTADGTVPDRDYTLWVRTGDMDPSRTARADLKKLQPTGTSGAFKVFEFDVKPKETDAFYQRRSNWCFMPLIVGEESSEIDPDNLRTRRWIFQVEAFRDPSYVAE